MIHLYQKSQTKNKLGSFQLKNLSLGFFGKAQEKSMFQYFRSMRNPVSENMEVCMFKDASQIFASDGEHYFQHLILRR